MTSVADKARAAALQVEAKKHALRQQQDGCWILTMKVHQNDMPEEIMKAAMGQRYVCALVAVDDDETPKPSQREQGQAAETKPRPVQSPGSVGAEEKVRRKFDEMSPAQQSGMLCNEQPFCVFLKEKFPAVWEKCDPGLTESPWVADQAAAVVREICQVNSRADIKKENGFWNSLVQNYRAWQREAEVVPA